MYIVFFQLFKILKFYILQTNVSSLTTDLHELKIFSDSEHKKSIKFELGLDLNKKELEKIKISNEQLKSQVNLIKL